MSESLSTSVAAPERARTEIENLQGTWRAIAGQRWAELRITGNAFTFRFEEGDRYVGTLEVRPEDQPTAMDMIIAEGPSHHRGLTTLCIYELEGDEMRWCPSDPGSYRRPAQFASYFNQRALCLLFQRDFTDSHL